jgi:hypothetical protein
MTDKPTLSRRRRYAVHQIICRRDIKPLTKIVARNIAAMEYASEAGSSTPASDMTIAKRAGVKLHEATAAVKELKDAQQLYVAHKDGRRRIHLIVRDGHEPMVPPIAYADSKFFKGQNYRAHIRTRENWLDRVFADPRLTNSAKLIAYGILAVSDPYSLRFTETMETIAAIVGYANRSTASRSIPFLIQFCYLRNVSTVALEAEPLQTSCEPVAEPLHARCGRVANPLQADLKGARFKGFSGPPSEVSEVSEFSGFPGISGFSGKGSEGPSVLRPRSRERGSRNAVRFTHDECARFVELVDLLHDHSSGSGHKTVAGIVVVSGGGPNECVGGAVGADVYDYPYYPDEIQKFVRAKLLSREGQRIKVTDLGWRQYNLVNQQQEQAA